MSLLNRLLEPRFNKDHNQHNWSSNVSESFKKIARCFMPLKGDGSVVIYCIAESFRSSERPDMSAVRLLSSAQGRSWGGPQKPTQQAGLPG